jgi:ATP-dependent Clp protease ATP-binding subunit ClpA
MFERFTESAIKAIMLAQEEARRLGHNFVGTEQILLGLIWENNGIAAQSLKSHGVTLANARAEIEKIIGRGDGFVSVEIPFTPRSKSVLETSCRESMILADDDISTQHLLLGILREGNGVACRVLGLLEVDRERLRVDLLKAMGKVEPNFPDAPVVPKNTDLSSGYEYSWYEPNAIAAIKRARGIAETLGASTIEAEHLCLALLRDSELLQMIQAEKRIDLSALRQQLLNGVPVGGAVPAQSMSFSSEATEILTNAWKVVVEEKAVWVTREAILLGALREDNGVFCKSLRAVNEVPDEVTRVVIECIAARKRAAALDKVAAKFAAPVPDAPTSKPESLTPAFVSRSPASSDVEDGSVSRGWSIGLGIAALVVGAIFLTDHDKFVLIAPVLLLVCFVLLFIKTDR